jgi:hypothetical protein
MELLSTAIIREWDGNDCIGDLGEMIYMSTVSVDDNGKTDDRCVYCMCLIKYCQCFSVA